MPLADAILVIETNGLLSAWLNAAKACSFESALPTPKFVKFSPIRIFSKVRLF